ncbi:hypothetical protein FB451DRAFT_1233266 [Mycena latifolia]|nr:hypothetical protein FB451DRAFT_1233266 [Mycena latifolia]
MNCRRNDEVSVQPVPMSESNKAPDLEELALSGRSLSVARKPSYTPSSMKAKLIAFTHLSQLFCLGVESSPAVAVTGTIEKEQISLVVSTTDSRTEDNKFVPRVLEIVPEVVSSDPSIFTRTSLQVAIFTGGFWPLVLARSASACVRLHRGGKETCSTSLGRSTPKMCMIRSMALCNCN